jgi:CRISPR/Cas system CSM-associated protein Csm3 (group 7 of RAMP superfamily)
MESIGVPVVGYGAAAKGNTFLNFSGINMEFIIDDNPLKQGLYTPGSSIPIYGREHLEKYSDTRLCFIPLAWNFYDEIIKNIMSMRSTKDDFFVRYFPKFEVVESGIVKSYG